MYIYIVYVYIYIVYVYIYICISHDIPIYPIRSHIFPLNSGYVQHVAPESGATARFLGQMSETTIPWRSTAIISLGDIFTNKKCYMYEYVYML